MSNSVYLSIAILFIRADLRREKRLIKKKQHQVLQDIPWNNTHLLRDIGMDQPVTESGKSRTFDEIVSLRMRSICRLIALKIPT
ncbi:hypothetical protein VA7868_01547 [Vibrio aerogenes CECT 7868]|uniref:DUF1127 domain-containing protein n=1 Tax=Vibrio aerogenes CECT 7868 TaxID=1216006 RepID=A0A1M5Y8J1_9VIBR|nr:hypothetical protein [Vibrio aerogenes]SHI08401.1 hypothetical protein VA7868_01547 [Vibrio aerogenes CECT 7868]